MRVLQWLLNVLASVRHLRHLWYRPGKRAVGGTIDQARVELNQPVEGDSEKQQGNTYPLW